MEKLCTKCNVEKQLVAFSNKKASKDGKSTICKECTRNYTRKHYQNNKEYYLNKTKKSEEKIRNLLIDLKKKSKCAKCSEERWWVLDFHHLDSSIKDFNIGEAVRMGYSISTIKKEIEKCIIVCSNCYRDIHYHNSL